MVPVVNVAAVGGRPRLRHVIRHTLSQTDFRDFLCDGGGWPDASLLAGLRHTGRVSTATRARDDAPGSFCERREKRSRFHDDLSRRLSALATAATDRGRGTRMKELQCPALCTDCLQRGESREVRKCEILGGRNHRALPAYVHAGRREQLFVLNFMLTREYRCYDRMTWRNK